MSVLKKASRNSVSEEISQECATDRHSDTPPFSLPRSNFSCPLYFICHSTILSASLKFPAPPRSFLPWCKCAPTLTFSAGARSSFAFASVVWMRSYFSSCVVRLRSSARRCDDVRPNLRKCLPCLMLAGWQMDKWWGEWIRGLSRCRAMDAGRPSHADQRLCGSAMLVICQLAVTCKPVSGV